ncbi:hypothetical protein [Methylobacterium sp. J-090]|uniref:hypothetical protein n=1 Tax=Methylobacterium sp. J-090 TaxID=2836666 RepID=UPI001FBB8D7D|nr:hypothetical protein [Methylobacterium sp. J-090]MCJ2082760.1 hypothetical protein [Methylobacterium sp. J-090]
MSEADSLRMVAEVVDKFSSPLRNLRNMLQGMSKDGGAHTKVLSDGLNKVEGAAKSAAQTATTVLNPALATIGVTGLGVTAALAGIQAAVRNFTTNASGLGQLGRDTGIAAQQLRDVQSILGKVGVDAGSSASGIQAFAESMRQARAGIGPIMEFLRTQGKTTEGRAYFNRLADDLMRSKDNGEALSKALKGLEGIEDPAGRRVYAEQVLRMGDAARLAEKHRGTIDEQLAKAGKEAGPLTPEMVQSAENYDKAMSGLAATMRKIGTAIAMELEGPLAKVAVTMKSFLDDERKGTTPAIVQTIRDAVAYIESIDWNGAFAHLREGFGEVKTELGGAFKQIRDLMAEFGAKGNGDAVSSVFKEIGAAANDTARAIRAVALSIGVLKDLKNLDFTEAGKKLAEIDRATDASVGKRSNAQPSKPTDAQTETMLGIITGGKPEDAAKAQREAEAHRREQGKLIDEMRRLREALPDKKPGEATVQQQSFDAAAPLGGLIQKASFGGMGAMARVGNSMAAIQGGGRGLDAQGDPQVMDRFRAYRENRGIQSDVPRAMRGVGRALGEVGRERQERWGGGGLPGDLPRRFSGRPDDTRGVVQSGPFPNRNFGGGKFNVLSGMPPLGISRGGPADRVGRALRGEPSAEIGPLQGANPGDYKDVLDHIARSEGTANRPGGGYDTSLALGKFLPGGKEQNLTGKTLDEIDTLQTGMLNHPQNGFNSSAIGRYQVVRTTLRRMRRKLGLNGDDLYDEKLQDRIGAELARARGADPTGLKNEWASLVGDKNRRAVELMQRVPRGASTVPQDRPAPAQRERADGEGFAARQRAMRSFEQGEAVQGAESFAEAYKRRQAAADKQRIDFEGDGGKSLMAKASRSAMLNGGGTNVRGDVSVIVNKPGPDTKVSTSASGNLFRDVKLNRGATMAEASKEN